VTDSMVTCMVKILRLQEFHLRLKGGRGAGSGNVKSLLRCTLAGAVARLLLCEGPRPRLFRREGRRPSSM
jgi:hypothetical protein